MGWGWKGPWARRLVVAGLLAIVPRPAMAAPLPTSRADFFIPGSQSGQTLADPIQAAAPACRTCHGGYIAGDRAPYDGWVASLMAQAARDPVTRAAAALAGVEAPASTETCARCHAPAAWLSGHSADGVFTAPAGVAGDGVTCQVCHRLVDPIARSDAPLADAGILEALATADALPGGHCRVAAGTRCGADADCPAGDACAVDAGDGRYVLDPRDSRRGPSLLTAHRHPTTFSSLFTRSDVCAPCHDVSNPTLLRSGNGWIPTAPGTRHPTGDPRDMFPEQRTFSEWRASAFARGGVVFPDGRFGGTRTATLPNATPVATCQDCHMPGVESAACLQGRTRPQLGAHTFHGANTWVLGAILDEHGAASGLTPPAVEAAAERTRALLARAADLEVTQRGGTLSVRVVNQTGHKLPTGYPEGRRMWLTVEFFDAAAQAPIAVDGAYDDATATLDVEHTTRIYEARHVVAPAVATLSGVAAGTPFHLALNSAVALDNRIPPRGATRAGLAAVGAAPVGTTYADGQHWDDVTYPIPATATRVRVRLRFQTTSKEYAEFLRDATPDDSGPRAHAAWLARGRSAPTLMAAAEITLAPYVGPCDDHDPCTSGDLLADAVCAGAVTTPDDVRCVLGALALPATCTAPPPPSLRRAILRQARVADAAVRSLARILVKARRTRESRRPIARARRALGALEEKLDAAFGSGSLDSSCHAALQALASRASEGLQRLQP